MTRLSILDRNYYNFLLVLDIFGLFLISSCLRSVYLCVFIRLLVFIDVTGWLDYCWIDKGLGGTVYTHRCELGMGLSVALRHHICKRHF